MLFGTFLVKSLKDIVIDGMERNENSKIDQIMLLIWLLFCLNVLY